MTRAIPVSVAGYGSHETVCQISNHSMLEFGQTSGMKGLENPLNEHSL